ncbi:MAG TPA: CRTAC1 family protein [Cyclobacteriaceae bacterium]
MFSKTLSLLIVLLLFVVVLSCQHKPSCHEEMVAILKDFRNRTSSLQNQWYPTAKLKYMDSLLQVPHSSPSEIRYCTYLKANILMEMGEEAAAIKLFESVAKDDPSHSIEVLWRDYGIAELRQGERMNCISNHASASCIVPIKGLGLHQDMSGSRKAIEIYEAMLTRNPNDLESRWLLNIAYMTLGKYPQEVPKQFLIPGMEGDTTYKVEPFQDIASDLKLDVKTMAGGSIVDDFDNDGYLDLIISGWGVEEEMHYFKNDTKGSFIDVTDKSNLKGITGGLNMVQADYNNDGYVDILVLRGAWKGEMGKEPNSLLKNNGDGTFTDVTTMSGLLSFHPTQTATWNDFNNDGWLDLFIGNEHSAKGYDKHPCELYMSNQDGTFTEMAAKAKCNVYGFVKGVTSGDYDNDGLKDIFISTMDGNRGLLKNKGGKGKDIQFEDVTHQAGLDKEYSRSFPTWFWDYNNDGWLDIFVCDYTFERSLAYYEAAEKLGIEAGNKDKMLLYRNNHDGTFTNVAKEVGLNENVFAMGSNFGDIDNDGYLDMYLGTGNPNYQSLVPNKMFKNLGGEKFVNVTASARVGHLQKGHGVSFADMDNDGDQDIHIEMGGAYGGDAYQNSFFLNPGQGNNNWINIKLVGDQSNKSAIGSQVKVTFKENGVTRNVYRDVNSGGSFGASPMRREIGVGQAKIIDEIEIHWHGSDKIQVFKNIKPNQFIRINESSSTIEKVPLKKIEWTLPEKLCAPLGV